jgi:hypothetical protein
VRLLGFLVIIYICAVRPSLGDNQPGIILLHVAPQVCMNLEIGTGFNCGEQVDILDLNAKLIFYCALQIRLEYGEGPPPQKITSEIVSNNQCHKDSFTVNMDLRSTSSFLSNSWPSGSTSIGAKTSTGTVNFLWLYDNKKQSIAVCAIPGFIGETTCVDMTVVSP